MTRILPATRATAPEVIRFLIRGFSRDDGFFQRVIGLDWGFGIDEIGFAMLDGSQIVGFFGLHHSVRTIRGQPIQITGMHSVAVDPAYRGRGTGALVEAALGDTSRHYIAWTANPVMTKRYLKLGFQPQDADRCLAFPGAAISTLMSWPRVRRLNRADFDLAVGPETRRLFEHHRGGVMREYLFRALGRPLGVITRKVYSEDGRYPLSEVVFASDPELMRRCLEPVGLMIHLRDRTAAISMNPPELKFRPARARPAPGGQLYRSSILTAGDFNQLYGELLVLP